MKNEDTQIALMAQDISYIKKAIDNITANYITRREVEGMTAPIISKLENHEKIFVTIATTIGLAILYAVLRGVIK